MKNKEKLVSYCRENNLPILHKQTDFGDMLYTKWGNMTVNMYRLTDMSASYVPINVFKLYSPSMGQPGDSKLCTY